MDDGGLRVEILDDVRGARLSGELDLASYEEASEALSPLFGSSDDVVLDVSDLSFMDSSGIRLLIRLHQSIDGGGLVVRSPKQHLTRLLEIAGLPDLGVRVEDASA
jgi:anti-sigma B factor antagonist